MKQLNGNMGTRLPIITLEVSQNSELFHLLKLYWGNGLEMTGQLVVTLERDCMITVDSYHGLEMYIFMYSLTKYLYNRGQPKHWTRKWS